MSPANSVDSIAPADRATVPARSRLSQEAAWWRAEAPPVGVILIAAILLARPLWPTSLAFTWDGLLHLYRAIDFQTALGAGQFWPRVAPTLFFGYGYPVFEFYGPLIYFGLAAFTSLGLTMAGAVKAITWLALILPGLAAYGYGRQVLPRGSAALVGVLYLAAPYHLFDLYYRGGLSEALAYAAVPLLYWAITGCADRPGPVPALALGVVAALITLTHGLTAFLLIPFAGWLGFVLIAPQVRRSGPRAGLALLAAGAGAVVALTLTSVHWLPVLADREVVQLGRLTGFRYSDFFTEPHRILAFDPIARFGGAGVADDTGAGRLHLLQAVGVGLGFAATLHRRGRLGRGRELIAWTGLIGLGLGLASSLSAPLWQAVPLLDWAQFPWRFLGLVALPAAFIAGSATAALPRTWQSAAALIGAGLAVVTAGPLHVSHTNLSREDLEPTAIVHHELDFGVDFGSTGEFLPRSIREVPRVSAWAISQVTGDPPPAGPDVPLVRAATGADWREYRITAWPGGRVSFDTAWFPGWEAKFGDQPLSIGPSPETGLIHADLPAGDHTVELRFTGTPIQRVAGTVSAIAAVGLTIGGLVWARRRGRPRMIAIVATLIAVSLGPAWIFGTRIRLAESGNHRPLDVEFGSVRVTGYRLPSTNRRAGESVPVELEWTADRPTPDTALVLRLVDRSGRPVGQTAAPVETGGRLTRRFDLPVAVDAPPGSYQVQVSLTEGGRPQPPSALWLIGHLPPLLDLRLGPIAVRAAPFSAPNPGRPTLDREIAWLGTDVSSRVGAWWRGETPSSPVTASGSPPRVRAGDVAGLAIHWQALRDDLADRSLRLSLVDDHDHTWLTADAPVADGLFPISYWSAGQRVLDHRELYLPPDLPPGRYRVTIESTADPNESRGNRLVIGEIEIAPAIAWPDPASYSTDRIDRRLSEGLRLITARIETPTAVAGSEITVESRWVADRDLPPVRLWWELVDSRGQIWGRAAGEPIGRPGYPTDQWSVGTVVRGRQIVPIDPFAPAGDLMLRLTADLPPADQTGEVIIGTVRLPNQSRVESATFDRAVGEVFTDRIELAGFELDGADWTDQNVQPPVAEIVAGRPIAVRLFWRSRRPVETAYTVFTQLIDASGRLVAQHDGPPQGGARPTDSWRIGEYVADDHRITGARDLPPGRYRLIVGLYDPVTGGRLTTSAGADNFVLVEIVLKSAH